MRHNGTKIDRAKVAPYINNYFINVGKVTNGAGTPNPNIGLGSNSNSNLNLPPISPTCTKLPHSDSVSDMSYRDQIGEQELPDVFKFYEVTEQEVLKIVKEINVSKSPGLENVSSFILNESFQILSYIHV